MRIAGRDIDTIARADVVVAGSGPGGLGAALSAARSGASVVLCERYGFLGGNFTAAAVGSVCGYYGNRGTWETPSFEPVIGGVASEILDSLAASGNGMGPIPFKEQTAVFLYKPWAAKRLFDHMISEAGRIDLLLHTVVVDTICADDEMQALVVGTKNGLAAVEGRVFIDATGDADVSKFSGVETIAGSPDGAQQFASMQFFMANVDDASMLEANAALSGLIERFGDHLSRDGGAVLPTFNPGQVTGAMTRVRRADGGPLDATDVRQATYGELEGRRLAEEAAEFLRAHVPGFEFAYLSDTAVQLGVRETRHVVGDYVLTGDDVRSGARFDDAVASCSWPQEYHTTGRSTRYEFLDAGLTYQVPYRCLVPNGPRNLLVVGRAISADHDALASVRVMAPCLALGQAAGTAAVMVVRDDLGQVRDVDTDELRSELLAAGARTD